MPERRYFETVGIALGEEMERDESVFILGEDVGLIGGTFRATEGLMAEYGSQRVRDTPIAEAAIVGLAIGAAMAGMRPVAELMTLNFGIVAMDQIVNHASKARYMFGGGVRLPMVIRAPGGGGTQKAAQHSHSIESWFMNTPGIRVVIPSTPYDLKGLLKTAIRSDDPVLFIEHEMLYNTRGEVPDDDYLLPFGVADVKRPGRDVTIVAWSKMVHEALRAAEMLGDEGIEAEVIDPRTLDPLDIDTILMSVARTRRAVIAEEGWRNVGVGAELAARIQEHLFYDLDAPVQRVAAADVPTPYAKNLEKLALPDARDIVEAVLKITL
ncbi:MAG: alpha-ketoacid dehydrogenase subunit beta [Deltaproteobacteria bacterium]|nr:alpha-ketoacid dehydrogenase subunit beta [Deltaproteobacteria bacterium]MBW2415401.1 alpha-ketoacid dehydrogenase subunit beta [Deltaproteobacteria bacterium]